MKVKNAKFLVTGGSGYIGSILIPKLLANDNEVILFDNFSFGIRSILHFVQHPKLSIIKGDVREEKLIKKAMEKADYIIHLAAVVGFPACAKSPHDAKMINVEGSRNIAKNLSKGQKTIFASTGSTYGKIETICDENTPIAPLTLYGSTKAEAEKIFLDSGAVAMRFATVFGLSPRLRLDLLINDFVYQALHNHQIILYESSFKRTFLHVEDAALSIVFAADNFQDMEGEPFNIGHEQMNYTKKDIALLLKKKINFYLHEAEIGKDLDQRNYEVSYKKVRNLGYTITKDIDAGLEELIKVLKYLQIYNEWKNV
jgi:nucleoside-diphosphate-sugar epimerase